MCLAHVLPIDDTVREIFGCFTFTFNSPPARRGFDPIPVRMGWDESAPAPRGRKHVKTSIHLVLCAYNNIRQTFAQRACIMRMNGLCMTGLRLACVGANWGGAGRGGAGVLNITGPPSGQTNST